MKLTALVALVLVAAILSSQPAPREHVGPLPGGGFLLPTGWLIRPAGRQIPLDTFPMASALSPDGRYLLVLNGGYRPPSISVIETASAKVVSSTPVADAWLGIMFSSKGDRVYVGGGSRAAVFEFTFSNGALSAARTFPVVPEAKRTNRDFIGDVALSPDGRLIYAADLYRDSVVVINPQSGMLIERFPTGRRPYRILFHPDGKSFFVSHWADGSVGHYESGNGNRLANVRIGNHPTDMVWREGKNEPVEGEPGWVARIFVAAANTNNVYSVAVSGSKELNVVESINVAMTPRQPLGMTPSALAVSPDGTRLYIVCSDANAVAVSDISLDRTRVLGFVPTGWYPTAARVLSSGVLVVLNGRGLRSFPNAENGPNPSKRPAPIHEGGKAVEFVGRLQTGTASWIDPFTPEQLAEHTGMTLLNSPYRDEKLDQPSPLPAIEHVVYIVKENRTYDQVLGDLKQGNGDPNLVLFGENISPNHHKLAREFVLFDNFYVNADVSADGHNWSTAAIAPDYVQKLWPNSYAGRRRLSDYAQQDPASKPPAGYLWTGAAGAGISMRNYGYMVDNLPKPGASDEVQVRSVRDPVLAPVTNLKFRGFDVDYPDMERAKVFLADLAEFEKSGQMPRLILMRLGNDHTSGTSAGKISPLSSMADNDYAFGTIVEAISKSRFWASTAIFVLEDDAQNGPDHVDAHRSPAYVISPFVKRRAVDSTMYNTTSMLRTIEFLLGLRPMTHFDAGARAMSSAFQRTPDTTAYTVEKPRIRLDERNPANSATAARSAQLRFDEADEIDDDELNDILWRAIRKDAPPPPVRSYFGR